MARVLLSVALLLAVLPCVVQGQSAPLYRGQEPERPEPEVEFEVEEAPRPLFTIQSEYLAWWIRDSDLPPLASSGPSTDIRPGALGLPATLVLFGSPDMDNEVRSGGRFTVSRWSGERLVGLEASYLFLGQRSIGFLGFSSGDVVLARPFLNTAAGEDASLIAYPGLSSGIIDVALSSHMHGAEGNVVGNLFASEAFRFEGLAGFRYLNLEEGLRIDEVTNVGPLSPRFPSTQIRVTDQIDASNNFYGGQMGMRAGATYRRLDMKLTGKIAIGAAVETVDIRGITTTVPRPIPAAPVVTTLGPGFLALATNSGRATQTRFAIVPEIGISAGFRITENFRFFGGYTFMHWNHVVRPGNQIDRALNPNLIPTSATFGAAGGPARPARTMSETDFWAQGVSAGLEFRY